MLVLLVFSLLAALGVCEPPGGISADQMKKLRTACPRAAKACKLMRRPNEGLKCLKWVGVTIKEDTQHPLDHGDGQELDHGDEQELEHGGEQELEHGGEQDHHVLEYNIALHPKAPGYIVYAIQNVHHGTVKVYSSFLPFAIGDVTKVDQLLDDVLNVYDGEQQRVPYTGMVVAFNDNWENYPFIELLPGQSSVLLINVAANYQLQPGEEHTVELDLDLTVVDSDHGDTLAGDMHNQHPSVVLPRDFLGSPFVENKNHVKYSAVQTYVNGLHFDHCSNAQRERMHRALRLAGRLAAVAEREACQKDDTFRQYFGDGDANVVRGHFNWLGEMLQSVKKEQTPMVIHCDACPNPFMNAYVFAHDADRAVHVCQPYLDGEGLDPVDLAGTLMHELLHFNDGHAKAGLHDQLDAGGKIAYGQTRVQLLAESDHDKAVNNPDNLQFFAREVPTCSAKASESTLARLEKLLAEADAEGQGPPVVRHVDAHAQGTMQLQAVGCSNEPCGACTGTCVSDEECAGTLKCLQRAGDENVPGCLRGGAEDFASVNYCYSPPVLASRADACSVSQPCGVCEGSCSSDSHCAPGLKCLFTDTLTHDQVPDCLGDHQHVQSFCFRPMLAKSSVESEDVKAMFSSSWIMSLFADKEKKNPCAVKFVTTSIRYATSKGPFHLEGEGNIPSSCYRKEKGSCTIVLPDGTERFHLEAKTTNGWNYDMFLGGTRTIKGQWADKDKAKPKYLVQTRSMNGCRDKLLDKLPSSPCAVTFVTTTAKNSESGGRFELRGKGKLPTECHKKEGDRCTIVLPDGTDEFRLEAKTTNGWNYDMYLGKTKTITEQWADMDNAKPEYLVQTRSMNGCAALNPPEGG
jgi:hypothetical protein